MGADFGVNYLKAPEWDKAVLELTEGRGADHIVDLGGSATLNRSIRALRVGGRISLVGGLSGFQVEGFEIIPAILRKARLQAINVGSRDMFETMNLAIKQNGLRPIIDAVFPFEHSVEALQYLVKKGTHFGKICIKF